MEEITKYIAALEILLLAIAVVTRSLALLPTLITPLAALALILSTADRDVKVEVKASLRRTRFKVEDEVELSVEAKSNAPGILLLKALDDGRFFPRGRVTKAMYLGRGSAEIKAIAALPGRRKPAPASWAFYPLTLKGCLKGEVELPQIEIRPYLAKISRKLPALSPGAPRAPGLLAGPHSLEFLEVREYRPGDPYKLINWKAYARNPAVLYVNEKLKEGHSVVYVILDAGSNCRPDAIGHGASLALSLAYASIKAGNPVGLFVIPSGRVYLPPTDSQAGLQLVKEALMALETEPPRRYWPPPKADKYIYISCNINIDYIKKLCMRGKRVIAVEVRPVRGDYAILDKFLIHFKYKSIYCARIITWRPPLEPATIVSPFI